MNIINKIYNFQNSMNKKNILEYIFEENIKNLDGKNLILFGAGSLGKDFKYFLNSFSIYPIAFCDTNSKNKDFCGLPVISIETVLQDYSDSIILISSKTYAAQIKKMLLEIGISEKQIIYPNDFDETKLSYCTKINSGSLLREFKISDKDEIKINYLEKNKEEIEAVYNLFEDEKSKNLFVAKLATQLNFDCINYYSYFIKNFSEPVKTFGITPGLFPPANGLLKGGDGIENYFYFNNDVFSIENNMVYIDAGAYNGDTLRALLQTLHTKNMNFKEIIAFEPDLESINLLRNTIPKIKKITLEQKGLWSYTGKNKFISSENNNVLPGGTSFSNDGKLEIDVVKLDDYLGNKKIDFIKMDTPGGMIEALHGAADTIKKYTPILALGIYHHMDDIFNIPLYINYINPNYKLYLRHNQWLINETDLFAIK